MERSRFVLLALVFAFAGACGGPQGTNVAPPQDKEVLVTISHDASTSPPTFKIEVSPDPVDLVSNRDKVHWKVDNQTGVEVSVTLDKFKDNAGQGHNPFNGGDTFEVKNIPPNGSKNSPPSGNAKDVGYYKYTLDAVLSGTAHIVVDPGVIIGN